MTTKMFAIASLAILAGALILGGCFLEDDKKSGCVENETQECLCSAGESGVQTCTSEGKYTECDCSAGQCNPGFREASGECIDIDECIEGTHNCPASAQCQNTVGAFGCVCSQGYTQEGDSCVDMNECTLGTHECDQNASCENSEGSYNCTCDMGYDGDGMTCDYDECFADEHDCDENATCLNTVGSWDCLCNEGYQGDGQICHVDINTYVADVSDRPISVSISGMDDFTISGLSRVGWDIEVIETSTNYENTHKDPGLVSYPDITMRGIKSGETEVTDLAAWLNASDPTQRTVTLTLMGLGGETAVFELYNAKPVEGDATIAIDGGAYTMSELKIKLGPNGMTAALDLVTYTNPLEGYPNCPEPGHLVFVEGETYEVSCYPLDVLDVPREHQNTPSYLPSVRQGTNLFNWMHDNTEFVLTGSPIRRKSMFTSQYTIFPSDEVSRVNSFECFPATIHLFNPTKPYGYSYLFDVLIVNDWSEEFYYD